MVTEAQNHRAVAAFASLLFALLSLAAAVSPFA